MIEIIKEVSNNSTNPDLKDLNMRIGVHTGKIVAGIIGTKIVRYDIFGSDVLIANKMESNGKHGHVVTSEATKNLLEHYDKLDFKPLGQVDLETVSK
jgi:class 3 adenylate cyclase